MSITAYYKALSFTLHWEGGKSNNPADPGGRTNFGVTQATYNAFRRAHSLPLQSVFAISNDEVRTIYLTMYWSPSYAYLCDYPLALALFDTAVQFRPPTFLSIVGDALKVKQPGFFQKLVINFFGASPSPYMTGEMIAALKALDVQQQFDVAIEIVKGRENYRHARVLKNPSQQVFLEGWLRRDQDLEDHIRSGE